MMKHLLTIDDLSPELVNFLIGQALSLKHRFITNATIPHYPQSSLVNLFYEPSTRTRMSFELAAKRLGMHVLNLHSHHSSAAKGESIHDTIYTIAAMDVNFLVIRHHQNGLPITIKDNLKNLAAHVTTHIINAGDGQNEHPSQALLDLMTITEKKPNINALKIVIIGDLRHSRVANSLQRLFKLLKIDNLVLVAPEAWQPQIVHHGSTTNSLTTGLMRADVVIVLRIQHERFLENEHCDLADYRKYYALTKANIHLAKPNALIMHPGPINRGLEIDDVIADSNQSVILEQVQNGVYMRMAILAFLTDQARN